MGIAIKKLFAQVLFWLLEFLDAVFEMFRVLCGIDTVEYNDGGEIINRSIIEIFLESSAVTKAFLLILLVSIIVCAFSVIVAVIKNALNLKGGERKSHLKTVGQGFGSIIVTFVMAFVMIVGIWGSNEVLEKVYYATSDGSTLTIAGRLFDMSVETSYVYDYDNPIITKVQETNEYGDLVWETDMDGNRVVDENGEFIPVWAIDPSTGKIKTITHYEYKKDPNTGEYITESGWRNGHTSDDIKFGDTTVDQVFGVHRKDFGFEQADEGYKIQPMVEMESFNFVLAYFVTIMILVAIVFSMLGLVKRIFDLVALFILLPLISATIPLDDGARFKAWRETVVSKVVLAYGAVISVNIFLLVVPIIQNINYSALWNDGSGSALMSTIFKVFMLVGGALCINGGQLLLARILGTSADESREMAQSARALFAGAATGAGIVRGVKNAAVGGTNKYGRQVGGIFHTGSKALGGATNLAGNILGGAAYRGVAQRVSDKAVGIGNTLRGATSLRRPGSSSSSASNSPLTSTNNGGSAQQPSGFMGGLFKDGLVGAVYHRAERRADPMLSPNSIKPSNPNRRGTGKVKTPSSSNAGSSKSGKYGRIKNTTKRAGSTPKNGVGSQPVKPNGTADRVSGISKNLLSGDKSDAAYKPPKK